MVEAANAGGVRVFVEIANSSPLLLNRDNDTSVQYQSSDLFLAKLTSMDIWMDSLMRNHTPPQGQSSQQASIKFSPATSGCVPPRAVSASDDF